ncbi:acetaldehyde dehydrogenase (acetylating) [Shewanella eurypsychrophilus]|uniref:Acetaldehyde dehydrogenase n=1 Tax=Shewanella eurypsychrophilus TaxID=2593656 RepID=A0ABX6VFE4_9GAMM|nr:MULTISPECIES: acetaldehyde dehydrogenase (acetylating) [Shewanella]QFU25370.1 acetaldehyde dehydrogenase (acetylating) [Shewanella sp. YLB-09]QPG60513.1 acetaldehyde dehydrogenase (acetylating) [Shewanella eurypsychrophilus]
MSQTESSKKIKVAIIGSGNIGTDLMIKIMRTSSVLEMAAMVGIDAASDGLARAKRLGVVTTHEGIDGLVALPDFNEIKVVFDATSAGAHKHHDKILQSYGKQVIDLTPAAIGPYTVPVVNIDEHLDAGNVNMVTCGGQATIPMVAAVSQLLPVPYAEIIASVSSKSAGPGTRANIDEFTQTTARAIEQVGGAKKGKAIIILNPAEPPMIMRDTVFVLSDLPEDHGKTQADVEASIEKMVAAVQSYVPGYRLKQKVQFERFEKDSPLHIPGYGDFAGLKSSVFLEVEGAAHYLPAYAGNLDIMTSAALGTAEQIVRCKFATQLA